MKKALFDLSIRCFYSNGNHTEHRQRMKLSDVPKWLEAYKFTHPNCQAVSIKVWFTDLERQEITE